MGGLGADGMRRSDEDPANRPTEPRPLHRARPLRTVGLAWAAWAAGLLVLQWAAGLDRRFPGRLEGTLVSAWSQFDGREYLAIAADGYQQRQLVWFPLYPMSIRLVDAVVGDPLLSAVGLSLAAGLASALLLWRWLETTDLSDRARWCAVAVALTYPYAWFLYGVVYADALFLALCLGAFVLFERHRPGWAAVVAGLATATRPAGFAVVAGLLVLSFERHGVLARREAAGGWVQALRLPTSVRLDRLRVACAWPLVGLTGLVAYGAYQWVAWGSPLRFMTEQDNYHDPGTASLLKQQYFDAWYGPFDARHLATTTFQAVILVIVLVSVPAVGRRFGWGYATFVFGLALLPAVSVSTFMGVGRYLIPAFPAFALAGEWLSTRRLPRYLWLTASPTLMVVMAFGFARSWYLS